VLFLLLVGTWLAAAAQAENILVPNGDFSSPEVPADPGYVTGVPTNWTATGASNRSLIIRNSLLVSGMAGQSFGKDASYSDGPVVLRQADIGVPWVAGDIYTLSFDYGSGNTDFGHTMEAKLIYGADNTALSQEFSVAKSTGHFVFTAGAVSGVAPSNVTGNIGIAFVFTPSADAVGQFNALEAFVGNVTLSHTAVPEPGAIVLFATGLFGLLAYAWRKRK
jgi:hypothetical protein